MTIVERNRRANAIACRRFHERAQPKIEMLRDALANGHGPKAAAWIAGIPERTAYRYRKQF